MTDTSPGSISRDVTPSQTQRTFFSTTSANEFFDQLQAVLDVQHAQTLQAQEILAAQINAPIVALTAAIERHINARPPTNLQNPTLENSPIGSQPPEHQERTTTPAQQQPPERTPVSPYRSQYHPPMSPPLGRTPTPILKREPTAFTLADTILSALGGNTSGIKLPCCYCLVERMGGREKVNPPPWNTVSC